MISLEKSRKTSLKAGTYSENSRRKYGSDNEENMTLSSFSQSSSYMFLSSSSLSSPPLSDNSSNSFLSSPLLQPKGRKSQTHDRKRQIRLCNKNTYKHVPHRLKPPQIVAKRNARERKRVHAVNCAFAKLRKHVPYEPRHIRLTKVKTLRFAIEYIQHLQELIRNHDRLTSEELNIPTVCINSNHHYHHHYHHHHHRHLVLNENRPDIPSEAYPNQITPEAGTNVTQIREVLVENVTCAPVHNSNEFTRSKVGVVPIRSSSDTLTLFSKNSSPTLPNTKNVTRIRNLSSSYFHNDSARETLNVYKNPDYITPVHSAYNGDISIPQHSSHFINLTSSSYAPVQYPTLETMTYQKPISHFIPFHEPLLLSNNSSDIPVFQHRRRSLRNP